MTSTWWHRSRPVGFGVGGPPVGLFMLAYQLVFGEIGLFKIPPVTLLLIVLQVALFMGYLNLERVHMPTSAVCLSADAILDSGQFYRLLTSTLEHSSDIHLYYNMVSLAWTGIKLERHPYGSVGFAFLTFFLGALTGVTYCLLSLSLAQMLGDHNYLHTCVVGFSGVLFALKVLVKYHESFGFFSIFSYLTILAELVVIQLLVPNASFVGHLSGVLSGILCCSLFNLAVVVYFATVWPFKFPASFAYPALIAAWHLEVIKKPWQTVGFLSSGTPLVCLSARHIIKYHQWFRLISAAVEHSHTLHLYLCLFSFLHKSWLIEKKTRNSSKLFFFLPFVVVSTGLTYVGLSQLEVYITGDYGYSGECVQGLSGSLFALKIICFLCARPKLCSLSMLFEVAELFLLTEDTFLLYHITGIVTGLVLGILLWVRPGFQRRRGSF